MGHYDRSYLRMLPTGDLLPLAITELEIVLAEELDGAFDDEGDSARDLRKQLEESADHEADCRRAEDEIEQLQETIGKLEDTIADLEEQLTAALSDNDQEKGSATT